MSATSRAAGNGMANPMTVRFAGPDPLGAITLRRHLLTLIRFISKHVEVL
jgi:hypothetical protein